MKEKILKTHNDFIEWKTTNLDSCDVVTEPNNYPCFAYTDVFSWNCEMEEAKYLYANDIENIISEFNT